MHRALSPGVATLFASALARCALAGCALAGCALAGCAFAGCDCSGADAPSLDTESCSTHDVPLEEPRTIGRATLTPDDRRLVVSGLPATSRWVIGRGPALSIEPFLPTLDAVEALGPDGVIVLGSLGSGERLEELVRGLAELTVSGAAVPVFLVPGPRDRIDELDATLEARSAAHVISLAGVHVVEIGSVELLVVAGGVDGHYVLEGACHVDDLDDVIDESSDEHVRVLLGFDAPAGTALTRGLGGAEAGSALVRDALDETGFAAGIFAGPDTRVGEWMAGEGPTNEVGLGRRVIVAPLSGPAVDCADGSRAPSGPALVVLGPSGIGPAAEAPGGGSPGVP